MITLNDIQDESERTGVTMIQSLLHLNGQSESIEASLQGWRSMSERDKAQTKWAYETFCQDE